ncbi:uncharacterized protein LOC134537927 isoform X2 [Bacillus rossius redtenbacheri]
MQHVYMHMTTCLTDTRRRHRAGSSVVLRAGSSSRLVFSSITYLSCVSDARALSCWGECRLSPSSFSTSASLGITTCRQGAEELGAVDQLLHAVQALLEGLVQARRLQQAGPQRARPPARAAAVQHAQQAVARLLAALAAHQLQAARRPHVCTPPALTVSRPMATILSVCRLSCRAEKCSFK